MITGVQDVYYEVQDMKRAIAFYRNVLNLAVTEESADWSAMNVGGLRVGLDSTDGKPTPKRAILIQDDGHPSRRQATARQRREVRRGDRGLSVGQCRDVRRFRREFPQAHAAAELIQMFDASARN